jgi:hypothetical protein
MVLVGRLRKPDILQRAAAALLAAVQADLARGSVALGGARGRGAWASGAFVLFSASVFVSFCRILSVFGRAAKNRQTRQNKTKRESKTRTNAPVAALGTPSNPSRK